MPKDKFNFKNNNIIRGVDGGRTEEFKRPNHPDFMTSSELKAAEWTGVRQNELTREWEFWIAGEVKARVHESIATPQKLTETHLELFGLRKEGFDVGPAR